MNVNSMIDLSVHNLQMNYRSGVLTPEMVLNNIYDRLEASSLHPVWITVVPRAAAISQAKALGPASPDLPLYGVPFAVKDNIDVSGLQTTAACPAYSYTPEQSAFVVKRLQHAGAILIGKTNMDQFATGLVGTRSPYGACSSVFRNEYISGGSSSGSAVAVASGLVSFALGTDTAGSGRVPAAFNNIVGLKPSRGLLSTSGVVPACRSLDCVSIFSLSCADTKTVFEIAKAVDPADPFTRAQSPPTPALMPLRLGIPHKDQLQFFGNTEYERLYLETVLSLQQDGCTVIETDFEPFQQAAELLYAGPYVAERFAAVGEFIKSHQDQVDSTIKSIILASENFTAVQAYQAQYRLQSLLRQTEQIWKRFDILLLPTVPTAYKIEEVKQDPIKLNSNLGYYTNFINLLDLCGVAVPAGFGTDGLPFGITVVSQAFSESTLLTFADHIQRTRVSYSGNRVSKTPERLMTESKTTGWVALGVVGAHLSGQPLNYQLVERGAKLLRTTRTARSYRCFALSNTSPVKPGLVRVSGFEGPGIEIEVWLMPESNFGSFVAAIPPPLSIGTCELFDGDQVKGFLCEPYATANMPDITHLGSWRQYLQAKQQESQKN